MPLIKPTSPHAAKVSSFSLRDVERMARQMLIDARTQADELLGQARVDAEQIRARAYAEGLEQGRVDGRKRGIEEGRALGRQEALEQQRAALTGLSQTLVEMLRQVESVRDALLDEAQRDVIRLALAIARRVTRRLGERDADVLRANAADAERLAVSRRDLRISVHPSQLDLMRQTLAELQVNFPKLRHAEVTADETVAPGGCRVHTAGGVIDADLDVQVQRIADDLLAEEP
jgi:flagellar assembly protein FliH